MPLAISRAPQAQTSGPLTAHAQRPCDAARGENINRTKPEGEPSEIAAKPVRPAERAWAFLWNARSDKGRLLASNRSRTRVWL